VSVGTNFLAENNAQIFSAKIDDFDIVFTVDSPIADIHSDGQPGLHSAIMLSGLEPEIEFVEKLFSQKLEFNRIDNPQKKHSLSLHGVSSSEADLRIDLPWSKLWSTEISESTDIPRGLNWQSLNCEIVLSQVNLEHENLDSLQAGAVLLLPESYSGDWQIEVGIEEMNHKLRGNLDPDKFMCALSEDAESGNPIEGSDKNINITKVCLIEPVQLLPESLVRDGSLQLPGSFTEMKCHVVSAGVVRAEGELAQIGSGYGLYINRVLQ